MKLLHLDIDNPTFQNAAANTVIRRATFSDIKDREQRIQALDEFSSIVTAFGSISMVLESVDGQYVELKAQPEGVSLLNMAQASGKRKLTLSQLYQGQPEIFSQQVRADLDFLIQKNRENDKEDYSLYRAIEKIVSVYNAMVEVYISKADKIKELDQHFTGEDRYSLTAKQIHESRDLIKKLAKALEDLVHTYANSSYNFHIRYELKRKFSNLGDGIQNIEQLTATNAILRSFADFRVLVNDEEIKEGKVELVDPSSVEEEDTRGPPSFVSDISLEQSSKGISEVIPAIPLDNKSKVMPVSGLAPLKKPLDGSKESPNSSSAVGSIIIAGVAVVAIGFAYNR